MTLIVCPSHVELERFALGDIDTEVACGISDHVASCPLCREQLMKLEHSAHKSVREWLSTGRVPSQPASSPFRFFEWLALHSVSLRSRLEFPQLIAEYRLDGCLGVGGAAVVFQAWDKRCNRPVAIKVLRNELCDRSAERFEREVKIASRIDHPKIVKLLSTTKTKLNKPALVMEYLPCMDLKAVIDKHGPLSIAQTATIGMAIMHAVRHLHSMQILHRDIKPRNTLLTENGQVKLIDFGIAVSMSDNQHGCQESTITLEGQLMGSIGFTSPQVLLSGYSPQTDLYSVCATMYYLLTGLQPFHQFVRLEEYLRQASSETVQPIAELRNSAPHPLFEFIETTINHATSNCSYEVVVDLLRQYSQIDCLDALIDSLDFTPPANLQAHEAVKALSESLHRERTQPLAVTNLLSNQGRAMVSFAVLLLLVGTVCFLALQRDHTSSSGLPLETLDEIVAITKQELSTDETHVATQLALYNVSIRLLEAELQRSKSLKAMVTLLDVYHNRGILEAGRGTQAQAIEYFRQELELAGELLAKAPDNLEYAAKQTSALGALAVMQLNLKNYSVAERELRKCLELERRILVKDRRLEPVASNHCVTYLNLSHLYLETERPELAQDVLREAWSYLEENWEPGAAAVAHQRNLLRLNSHLAHAGVGNFAQAIADLEACIQEWESLLTTATDPNTVRMRLVESLREGADTYLASGDREASLRALSRANLIAEQVTPVTPNNKFHRAVAAESSLNLAMLATQYPTQMSDVNVSDLISQSRQVFRQLYEVEPVEGWVNQLKRTFVCEAAALRTENLERAIEKLESFNQLPDSKFSLQLWRDFAREYSLCSKATHKLSRRDLELRLGEVWRQNQRWFRQFEN